MQIFSLFTTLLSEKCKTSAIQILTIEMNFPNLKLHGESIGAILSSIGAKLSELWKLLGKKLHVKNVIFWTFLAITI